MRLADKIKKFDDLLPGNLEQFESLLEIKVEGNYKKSDLVEILEPVKGNLRKISINDNILKINLEPVIDGRSKFDALHGGRKFYEYTATDLKGNFLAKAHSVEELAKKVGVTGGTILNVLKRKNEVLENTGGRQRVNILVYRKELEKKEDRKKVIKNKQKFYYMIYKDGKCVKKFKGAKDAANFLNVSVSSIFNYSENNTKNKQGYSVQKKEII